LLVLRDDFFRAESIYGGLSGRSGHRAMQFFIREKRYDSRRLSFNIARAFQEAVYTVRDQLRHAAYARRHGRHSACHRFQRH